MTLSRADYCKDSLRPSVIQKTFSINATAGNLLHYVIMISVIGYILREVEIENNKALQ